VLKISKRDRFQPLAINPLKLTSDKLKRQAQASRRDNMKIYGYDIGQPKEQSKFTMDIEELCMCVNTMDGLNSNCFIFTAEEDRDLHFNQNTQASEQKG